MNEKIDLTEILKDCPKGWEFYHLIYGDVYFVCIDLEHSVYPIRLSLHTDCLPNMAITKYGRQIKHFDGECVLFPSKDQRDWSKFTAPWYKKERFDPKTLQPFDKVITRIDEQGLWCCDLFSFIEEDTNLIKGCGAYYKYCVPYNNDTKHLIGTTDEAPEYYRYWEN